MVQIRALSAPLPAAGLDTAVTRTTAGGTTRAKHPPWADAPRACHRGRRAATTPSRPTLRIASRRGRPPDGALRRQLAPLCSVTIGKPCVWQPVPTARRVAPRLRAWSVRAQSLDRRPPPPPIDRRSSETSGPARTQARPQDGLRALLGDEEHLAVCPRRDADGGDLATAGEGPGAPTGACPTHDAVFARRRIRRAVHTRRDDSGAYACVVAPQSFHNRSGAYPGTPLKTPPADNGVGHKAPPSEGGGVALSLAEADAIRIHTLPPTPRAVL